MNVSLTPELDRLVKKKVATGMYNSASEVVREALRFFQFHDDLQQQKLEMLKSEINKGLNSLDAGKGVEMTDDLFDGIKQQGRAVLQDRINE
ncbi:MAG: type II toxin-antitoxin system ParD family antitoxin [Candidatus Electrothrix sp. Rat3]|uniref:type II toxin-antitoxin system ParD family antitoxin n=1 Tax=Candidatus Electrothrix sp. TaxID=2170559 RepID=UPI00291C2401|nr:type II toxin-antitoxin system ParD family antitoxin [Candidatus Electrothrix rattekaaiensis]